jgi:thiamine-monophosphate kinase
MFAPLSLIGRLPFDIGGKIAAANVADILAMGGSCDFLTASVALTGNETLQWIENLARGMKHEADLAGAHHRGWRYCSRSKDCYLNDCYGALFFTHSSKRCHSRRWNISIFTHGHGQQQGLNFLLEKFPSIVRLRRRLSLEFSAPTLDHSIDFSGATAMADVSDSVLDAG